MNTWIVMRIAIEINHDYIQQRSQHAVLNSTGEFFSLFTKIEKENFITYCRNMEIFNMKIYPKQGFTLNVAFKQRRTRKISFSVILLHVNDHCQMEIWDNKHFRSWKNQGFHIAYRQHMSSLILNSLSGRLYKNVWKNTVNFIVFLLMWK